MEARGMNERIQKLRKQSVETDPRLYMERADLMTDAYLKYEGSVSVPEMRAIAFKHFMEHKKLCINDGELIVGEKGDGPQKAPTFPELCCHTLEDMNGRTAIAPVFLPNLWNSADRDIRSVQIKFTKKAL